MSRRIQVFTSFIILVLFMLLTTSMVAAQSQGLIRIDLISTTESEESMDLKVYFNLYDPTTGGPFTNSRPSSAEITLVNTGLTTPASIQTPDLPIYITLVLDASGSMAGNAQKLRDAAKMALTNPPDDAYFGVVQFDEGITLLQDFTQNLQLVNYAIDQYKTSFKGTCLYDAAFEAIDAQAKAPVGRRAVILFTDGMDEGRDGKQCSQHPYEELTEHAIELKVPIHTVGLLSTAGKINETELRNMAGITGGFSAISNIDELPSAFSRIMDGLKTQLVLESTVYPQKDQNQAVITITFEDGSFLNTAFFFKSETDYPGPPSPVAVRFDGLQLIAETQSYDLQLSITSPDLVGYVKVAIWDIDSGAKLKDFIFENPLDVNNFTIPTDQMTANRKYELRITAISREDATPFVITSTDQGKTGTEMLHEFSFDPSSIYASATIDSVIQEGSDLILNVTLTNPNMIGGFDGWLVDEATNTQVNNSRFTLSADAADSGRIVIPTRDSRISSGKYSMILRVLNAQNQVLTTTEYDGLTYTAPSLTQRLAVAIAAKPFFLAIIAGIILLVVVFLMLTTGKQKSMSSTPVMEGQLGKRMKNKKVPDGLQAIASDEPLLSKPAAMPQRASKTPSAPLQRTPAPAADATIMYGRPEAPVKAEPAIRLPAQYQLVALKGTASGPWLVNKTTFMIGRTEGDLVLNEASISRRHVQISHDAQDNYFITDMNSSNGTKVDGRKLTGSQVEPLADGAMIEIGPNVALRFERK